LARKQTHPEYELKNEAVMRQSINLQDYFNDEVSREKSRMRRKVAYAVLMLMAIYIIAILVFHTVEAWAWEDSIYFTTSTITTVGYGDLTPKTYWGRLFTIPLMWIGIAVGLFVIYTVQEYGRTKLESVVRRVEELRKNGKGL
jgi:hypothetical protein